MFWPFSRPAKVTTVCLLKLIFPFLLLLLFSKLKKRSFGFENNSDLDQNNDEIIANINRDSIISSLNKGRDNSLL